MYPINPYPRPNVQTNMTELQSGLHHSLVSQDPISIKIFQRFQASADGPVMKCVRDVFAYRQLLVYLLPSNSIDIRKRKQKLIVYESSRYKGLHYWHVSSISIKIKKPLLLASSTEQVGCTEREVQPILHIATFHNKTFQVIFSVSFLTMFRNIC